jgi:hypothetical protein
MYDVSGVDSTPVFRWLVVIILTFFSCIVSENGRNRTRWSSGQRTSLVFERSRVRSRRLSLTIRKRCQKTFNQSPEDGSTADFRNVMYMWSSGRHLFTSDLAFCTLLQDLSGKPWLLISSVSTYLTTVHKVSEILFSCVFAKWLLPQYYSSLSLTVFVRFCGFSEYPLLILIICLSVTN